MLTDPPTAEPTETGQPTPTDPPTPTEPPEPVVRPNLRVQQFELVREPVLVGEVAALTADITNFADTAAGPFTVEFFVDQPGEDELIFDARTIQGGLVAGAATVLTVSVTPDVAGGLRLIARVDPEDESKPAATRFQSR